MTRKRKKHTSVHQQLDNHFEEVKREFAADGIDINRDHSSHREGKISDRISFLVGPLLEDTDTSNFKSNIVAIACAAWNVSLLKMSERQPTIDKFIGVLVPIANNVEARAMFQKTFDDFIQRKLSHFPNDKRYITSYKVIPTNSGFQLSIASVDTENRPR